MTKISWWIYTLLALVTIPGMVFYFVMFNVTFPDSMTHDILPKFESIRMGATDFVYFYGGGRMIDDGLYNRLGDHVFFRDYLRSITTHGMTISYWGYPPSSYFLFGFLGLFSFWTSYFIWTTFNIILGYVTFYKLTKSKKVTVLLIFSPVLFVFYHYSQTSMITLFCISLGLLYNTDDTHYGKLISGIFFGLATIKYPFLIAAVVYLICSRSWKTLISMCITSFLMVAISCLCFGIQSWIDYFTVIGPEMAKGIAEINFSKMEYSVVFVSPLYATILTAFQFGYIHNIPWNIAWIIQGIISALCIISITYVTIKNKLSRQELIAFILSLSLVVSPYNHSYDLIFIAYPMYFLLHKFWISDNKPLCSAMFIMWTYMGLTEWIRYILPSFFGNNMNTINVIAQLSIAFLIFHYRDSKKDIDNHGRI